MFRDYKKPSGYEMPISHYILKWVIGMAEFAKCNKELAPSQSQKDKYYEQVATLETLE